MKTIYSLFTALVIVINAAAQNGVGIDEVNPASKMAIKGNLAVGDGYTTTAAPADGAIIKGSVGIGTTNPLRALTVNGIMEGQQGRFGELTAITNQRTLTVYFDNTYGNGTDGAGVLQPVRINVGYPPLVINPLGGNVGIGVTNPQRALSINGIMEGQQGRFGELTSVTNPRTINVYYDNTYGNATDGAGALQAVRIGVGYCPVVINPLGGNVGIGVTNPQRALSINGVMEGQQGRFGELTSVTNPRTLTVYYDNTYGNGTDGAGVLQPIRIGVGATALVINPSGGNVGVGVTNPTHKLQVNGTAGLSTGTSWTLASDIRLKDVAGNYERGLKEILGLNTIRFMYKKDNILGLPSGKEIIGFAAQEVEKLIPEAVGHSKDGYLELNVDPIHWAAINAIKELNKKIEAQQMLIDRMQAENTNVKSENKKLKSDLYALKTDVETIKGFLFNETKK